MLTELQVKGAKPKGKPYIVRDEIQTARARGESSATLPGGR